MITITIGILILVQTDYTAIGILTIISGIFSLIRRMKNE